MNHESIGYLFKEERFEKTCACIRPFALLHPQYDKISSKKEEGSV